MDEQKNSSAWASTTHAENTAENGLELRVDWVTCSFRTALNLHQLLQYLHIVQVENLEIINGARYGYAGYTITYKIGTMEIMYNEIESRFLINFSGQACREYELLSGKDFDLFFSLLTFFFPTYTRVDIAIDDFKQIYTVDMFRKACFKKQIVSRLKEWGNSTRGLIADGDDALTMDNFYLGSKSSRYFINVYDKKLERENKGLEVAEKSWTRTEIRFKNEYANQIVQAILISSEELGKVIFAFLNDKVKILKLSALKLDTNKARLSNDYENHTRWWRKFLNTTEKLHLTVYRPDMPLVSTRNWLLKQVSTSLAMFEQYYTREQFKSFLEYLTLVGNEKLDEKHLLKVNNQIMLDQQIEEGAAEIEWIHREVIPQMKKEEKLSKMQMIKKKDLHLSNLRTIYYETKHEQDKKEKSLIPNGN